MSNSYIWSGVNVLVSADFCLLISLAAKSLLAQTSRPKGKRGMMQQCHRPVVFSTGSEVHVTFFFACKSVQKHVWCMRELLVDSGPICNLIFPLPSPLSYGCIYYYYPTLLSTNFSATSCQKGEMATSLEPARRPRRASWTNSWRNTSTNGANSAPRKRKSWSGSRRSRCSSLILCIIYTCVYIEKDF